MNFIGRRIYYDKTTGNVILDTGEMVGFVTPTTIDEDFETYKALKERVRDTVSVIQFRVWPICGGFCTMQWIPRESRNIGTRVFVS